jgi:hypothetical protein
MLPEREIRRLALRMLDEHGDGARATALRYAAVMRTEGDAEGAAIWGRIAEAVGALVRS